MMPVDYRSYLVGSAFERIYFLFIYLFIGGFTLCSKAISSIQVFILKKFVAACCCCLWGAGTIALDPTFGSFTLLELVSHQVN